MARMLPEVEIHMSLARPGTTVKIDGYEIPRVRSVSVVHELREVPRVSIEMNAIAVKVLCDGAEVDLGVLSYAMDKAKENAGG